MYITADIYTFKEGQASTPIVSAGLSNKGGRTSGLPKRHCCLLELTKHLSKSGAEPCSADDYAFRIKGHVASALTLKSRICLQCKN